MDETSKSKRARRKYDEAFKKQAVALGANQRAQP